MRVAKDTRDGSDFELGADERESMMTNIGRVQSDGLALSAGGGWRHKPPEAT